MKTLFIFVLRYKQTTIMEIKHSNTNLHIFEEAVKTANEKLKLAKDFLYLVEMWNKRHSYKFEPKFGHNMDLVEVLGGSKTFFSCGSLSFDTYNVESYLRRYEISFDVKSPNFTELSKLKRIVKQFKHLEKNDSNLFWIITREFENLIQ